MTVAVDFDMWRDSYDTMTFADHQAFNAEVADRFPEQRCFDARECGDFLLARTPKTVVEIGGWDGALAAEMLGRFAGITTWLNYDITPNVPQACDDPRYDVVVLDEWPWGFTVTADALVASHVFEHMRMREVEWLLAAWDVRSVYVDCPISGPPDWAGYNGMHVIEAGAQEFLTRVDAAGWDVTYSAPGMIAHLDRRI